ncbi:hypothetical protein [Parasitella parasitica]|uniref:Reverse transcriptase n=1 Tax=Parasitella parasitica TaxID=35722 RepID=A0A0B7MMQ1_9FUNG|nr:hypothetical protein [Parasitella parasitica]
METESCDEYIYAKLALMKKAGLVKTESETVKDLKRGLLPKWQHLVWRHENDPYGSAASKVFDTQDKFTKLLKWAEQEQRHYLVNKDARSPIYESANTGSAVVKVNTVAEKAEPSAFEKLVLDKLEKITSEVASSKDLLSVHEAKLNSLVTERSKPRFTKGASDRQVSRAMHLWVQGTSYYGLPRPERSSRKGFSVKPSITSSVEGSPNENPDNPLGAVNIITAEESTGIYNVTSEEEVKAQHGSKTKQKQTSGSPDNKPSDTRKTGEEIKAVLLKNLEKARAAKAEYKRLDDEAIARGEVPPSFYCKQARTRAKVAQPSALPATSAAPPKQMQTTARPSMANGQEPSDALRLLLGLNVTMPVVQLLKHSPEVRREWASLMKFTIEPPASQEVVADSMDMDINHIHMDTALKAKEMGPISLQSVVVMLEDAAHEFLVDGGAMVSLISYQVVKDLGRTQDIHPTSTVIKYGDGVPQAPMGVIKLKLTFSAEVVVIHTFYATEDALTTYEIPTHYGDGLLSNVPSYLPEGAIPEEPTPLVLPVQVYPDPKNDKLLEVKLEYDWTLNADDALLLVLGIQAYAKHWREDKVLQPNADLWTRQGIYCLPIVLPHEGGDEGCSIILANLLGLAQTVKAGTILGKLYSARSIPIEVERIKTLSEVLELITDLSINVPSIPPSMFVGPVYEPDYRELGQAIAYKEGTGRIMGVNSVSVVHGPEPLAFDINPQLEPQQQESLKAILVKHQQVFATSLKQVGMLKTEPYEIQVEEGAKPVKVAPRMIPRVAQEWFQGYLDQLLKLGLIEPCSGPWAAAVVLVPSDAEQRVPRKRRARAMKSTPKLKLNDRVKPMAVYHLTGKEEPGSVEEDSGFDMATRPWTDKTIAPPSFEALDINGEPQAYTSQVPTTSSAGKKDPYRVCVNYKPVNKVMKNSAYPIPNINYLFSLLKNVSYFSVFDALKGFWQLPLLESLPMGMESSPMVWQAEMDRIFHDSLYKHFLCYIDDGLTYSATFEGHLEHLDHVLGKCEEAGLSLSLSKCKFGYQEVKLLGYIVNQQGLKMDPAKTQGIRDWPTPKSVADIHRFIGVVQFYRRFMPKLSEYLASLNELKKKGVKYHWTERHQADFEACKQALMTDPIMRHPDFDKEFILLFDASNIAIAGVLAQMNEEDPRLYHPIYFGSKALTEAERKISIYEKEFLAIVYFVHFFKLYLMGTKFTVYTDQKKSLQFLMKFNEDASAKLVRWQVSLLAYDFDIIYKAGTLNVHADAMSRLPEEVSTGMPRLEEVSADYYLPLNVVRKEPEDGFDSEGPKVVKKKKLNGWLSGPSK